MVEDDVQFENVITRLEQTPTPAEARAQTRAEARAETRAEIAQARAQAQEEAQRARDEAHRIRDEAHRIRDRVHRDVERDVRRELGVGQGPEGQGPEGVIVLPPRPPWEHEGFPPQIVDIVTMFVIGMVICIVGFPIARAFGRWIDRRGLPSPVSGELAAQMNRIEQAIDTMAVEVERISEAQRFQAKLLSDRENVRA